MKVFVYGTLRKGMYNYDLYLKDKGKFVQNAYIEAALYTLKDRRYPAIVEGDSKVYGELYEVDEKTLATLDSLEDYVPGRFDNEYDKVLTEIFDETGEVIDQLPVYWYNIKPQHQRLLLEKYIQEGDYVKYLESK